MAEGRADAKSSSPLGGRPELARQSADKPTSSGPLAPEFAPAMIAKSHVCLAFAGAVRAAAVPATDPCADTGHG
jgi:hypothetical protein